MSDSRDGITHRREDRAIQLWYSVNITDWAEVPDWVRDNFRPPPMQTFRRYWPDGSYCAKGREHLSWVEIQTTAPAEQIEAFGTEETPIWCGCGVFGFVATPPNPTATQ